MVPRSPRSSTDRMPPSEGGDVGSTPTEGTKEYYLLFMKKLEKLLVLPVEKIKKVCGCKTWHAEAALVLLVLVFVSIASGRGWIEWVGVAAVWFAFMYTSVANRLEEAEVVHMKMSNKTLVECYRWLGRYLYIKETLWFIYFALLGAWSALAGVVIFLLYGPWRRLWRKYHPLGT